MLRRVAAGMAVLVVLGACGGSGDDLPAPGEFGAPATDGSFTFTIHGFECGAAEVSRGLLRVDANATFCLLDLTVVNSGEQGRRFLIEPQRLIDEAGNLSPASVEGTTILNPDRPNEELPAGASIRLTVVFDVLNPTAVTDARLYDGVFSNGAVMPVRP